MLLTNTVTDNCVLRILGYSRASVICGPQGSQYEAISCEIQSYLGRKSSPLILSIIP